MAKPNVMSMKLVIDKSEGKVVYAEVGIEWVELFFRVLYMRPEIEDFLVNPKPAAGEPGSRTCVTTSYIYSDSGSRCSIHLYASAPEGSICPHCQQPINQTFKYYATPSPHNNSRRTFMIMNDLSPEPMPAISGSSGQLEERVVGLDVNLVLALLKAKTQNSKTILTDVFLAKKADDVN